MITVGLAFIWLSPPDGKDSAQLIQVAIESFPTGIITDKEVGFLIEIHEAKGLDSLIHRTKAICQKYRSGAYVYRQGSAPTVIRPAEAEILINPALPIPTEMIILP